MSRDWPDEIFPGVRETCAGKLVTFHLIIPFLFFAGSPAAPTGQADREGRGAS
jgi:hypothetical protein